MTSPVHSWHIFNVKIMSPDFAISQNWTGFKLQQKQSVYQSEQVWLS